MDSRMSWGEPIQRALDIVPMVPDCQWFLRDPVFAGVVGMTDTGDGRSYRDTASAWVPEILPGPADRRLMTITIPERPDGDEYDIDLLVHELGHVMDWMTGHDRECVPIGDYAASDHYEAFAEAFTGWLIPDYADRWGHNDLDRDDFAWFEANLR